jgi:hypothetical protein
MPQARRGTALYELVRAYAGLGDHRSGSQVDHRTATWLGTLLRSRGLDAEALRIPFDYWSASSSVTVGDSEVEHLPLAHDWTGHIDTTDVAVISFDPMTGGFPNVVDEPIARAQADGAAAAVLVTEHAGGALVAINRTLSAASRSAVRSTMPVVLAAGRDFEHLSTNEVRLTMSAHVEAGHTVNVIARSPGAAPDEERLLLTTPLNGWFRCAGERGTGIAALLDVVDQLAGRPIVVAGTGGHELGYFGAHRLVDEKALCPGAAFHIGASVAVVDQTGDLIDSRFAMTSLDQDQASPIAQALRAVGLDLISPAPRWIGEAEAWSRLERPLLSVVGAGPDFHTPGDLAQRVTSPAALVRVADAFGCAATLLADMIGGP